MAFTLDVAAYVDDPLAANKVYTRVATQGWSYKVDGFFSSPSWDGFSPGEIGNTVAIAGRASDWKVVTDGSVENDYLGGSDKTANGYLNPADWEDVG